MVLSIKSWYYVPADRYIRRKILNRADLCPRCNPPEGSGMITILTPLFHARIYPYLFLNIVNFFKHVYNGHLIGRLRQTEAAFRAVPGIYIILPAPYQTPRSLRHQIIRMVIIHDSKISGKSSKISECIQQPPLSHMYFPQSSLLSYWIMLL